MKIPALSYILASVAAVAICSTACRKQTPVQEIPADDVVVALGDSMLTRTEVLCRIPSGMAPADSAELFNSIVDGWVERHLLADIVRDDPDEMARIDRMAEQYRRRLMVASYRRSLRASHRWSVPNDSIRAYFRDNSASLILERPVLKGLYVKVPSDAARLADIRRWMMTATPDAIDNLERYGLADAIEYSFFEDKWTDWNLIARQIPYRFDNPDSFVATRQNFETAYGGMTYLLHISSFLPSGEVMPYEVAAPIIAGRLELESGQSYERQLIAGLYAKARKEGRLRDYREGYDAHRPSSRK